MEVFIGYWYISSSGVVLFVYYMLFDIYFVEDEMYVNFVLFIGVVFDDDVLKLEIELCLIWGRKVKVKFLLLGCIIFIVD